MLDFALEWYDDNMSNFNFIAECNKKSMREFKHGLFPVITSLSIEGLEKILSNKNQSPLRQTLTPFCKCCI